MAEVAVIGGTGFIGRALVKRLLEGGHRVRVAGRQGAPPGSGVIPFRAGVADREAMFALADGVDCLFHLATGGGETWAEFERDFIQGARNVAEACLDRGVRRLVYTSSIAALYLGGRRTIADDTPPDPRPHRRSFYARAKVEAERVLNELHAARGLPVVILRPGVVMGRGGLLAHGGTGYWASDLCCLGWGRGRTPVPFVLVGDVAAALAAALDAPGIEGAAFNLAGDVCLTAAEFVRILAERSRRNFRFYPQSLWKLQAIEIGKWLLKIAARKPDNPFPSYRDLKSRSVRAPFDCSGARKMLGWKPNADMEVFLREAVDAHLQPVPSGDLRLAARP